MATPAAGRRAILAVLVLSLSLSGCLTLDPSVTNAPPDSVVFESISVTEPWSTSDIRVEASLRSTPEAANVTTISVVGADGQIHRTARVDPGQTTVVLTLPVRETVKLVASDSTTTTTVESVNVTTNGSRVL
jgi:hypothetical protein